MKLRDFVTRREIKSIAHHYEHAHHAFLDLHDEMVEEYERLTLASWPTTAVDNFEVKYYTSKYAKQLWCTDMLNQILDKFGMGIVTTETYFWIKFSKYKQIIQAFDRIAEIGVNACTTIKRLNLIR